MSVNIPDFDDLMDTYGSNMGNGFGVGVYYKWGALAKKIVDFSANSEYNDIQLHTLIGRYLEDLHNAGKQAAAQDIASGFEDIILRSIS